jgi:hypothetical protein
MSLLLLSLSLSLPPAPLLSFTTPPLKLTFIRPNGQIFEVPIENVHVSPLHVGEVVTFSYDKMARRELPVNVKIFRRRIDMKWDDVVANSQSHHVQGIYLGERGEEEER